MDTLASIFQYLSDPANLGSVVAALGSGAFALISYYSQVQSAKKADETERRVTQLQQEGLRASLDAQVIRWGSEVIDLLAEAERLTRSRARFASAETMEQARSELSFRLSARVDQGRLFFPNVSHDLVGTDRPFANRGYRPPILDAMMLVHERLRRLTHDVTPEAAERDGTAVFNARRAFVSELQRALDPRRRELIFDNQADNSRLEARGADVAWDSVKNLVDEFEAEFGPKAFWRDPPRPRQELLANRQD
jgi:hypothetical protein